MATGKLVGSVVQQPHERPIPARLYVTGPDGTRYYPAPSLEHRAKRELEGHVLTHGKPFEVELPSGEVTVRVERGPEFIPVEQRVRIPAEGTVEEQFALKRWIDLNSQGWFCGDLHVHRRLADMHTLLLAEDVNVAMPLTLWEGRQHDPDIEMFAQHATPDGVVHVDDRHAFTIYNVEYEPARSPTGAVLLMGMNRLIEKGNPPPLGPVFEQAHRLGGFVDMEKHSWAWAPVIAATGKCDAFELANNHHWREKCLYIDFEVPMHSLKTQYPKDITGWTHYGFDSWYAYLNCGFRMAGIAGTANGVHPNPFGHNRVYVNLAAGEGGRPARLDTTRWKQRMLTGHSFVTNGPVLFLTVAGRAPGETIRMPKASTLAGELQLQSLTRPERLELVRGGDVVEQFRCDTPADADGVFRVSASFEVSVNATTYLAARAIVEPPSRDTVRFAHTGIVRVELPDRPLLPRRFEIDHFVHRIESMIAEIDAGKLKAGDAAAARIEYEQALATYHRIGQHLRDE